MNTLTKERYADELEGAFQKISAKNESDLTDEKLRYAIALKTLSNSIQTFSQYGNLNELLFLQHHAIIQSFKKALDSFLKEKDTSLEEASDAEMKASYQNLINGLRDNMPSKDPAITMIRLANVPLVLIDNADAIFSGTILFMKDTLEDN